MGHHFDTGFSVRKPMWHGLGNVIEDYPEDWDEARMASGLMWEPTKVQPYDLVVMANDAELPEGARIIGPASLSTNEVLVPMTGFQTTKRDDIVAGGYLGMHKASHVDITHAMMGELVEGVVSASGGKAQVETMGSLFGGAKVWALVRVDEPYHVKGDHSPTMPYLALQTHHDGQGACKAINTDIRVVCWNTWQAASEGAERDGFAVSLRHYGNVAERIEAIKLMLAQNRLATQAWRSEADELADINIDDELVKRFVHTWLANPEKLRVGRDGKTHETPEFMFERRAQERAMFMRLFSDSPTNGPLPMTAYKLVQTAGEWLDHIRRFKTKETYLTRTLLRPEQEKGKVIDRVRELALVGA